MVSEAERVGLIAPAV